MTSSYLVDLTIRLAEGLSRLPPATVGRHAEFIARQRQPDGGYAGREPGSDLYYTSFALRALSLLGELTVPCAAPTAGYLERTWPPGSSVVDFASWLFSVSLLDLSAGIRVTRGWEASWRADAAARLQRLRRSDGGFAKAEPGAAGSTYHTFLCLLCLELLGQELPDPEGATRFLLTQRGEDGGFREIRASKRSGTNPTAAAVAGLRLLGALEEDVAAEAIDFLVQMQTDEGGLRANTRIPIADLLSTFTGLLTLADLQGLVDIDQSAAVRYVSHLQAEPGGFRGALWDDTCDVEYTFYGLGCLALLHQQAGLKP